MKAPINSVKHVVQRSLAITEEQTISLEIIGQVVDQQATLPAHIVVGAIVKAVWCEYWILGESSQPCTCTWSLEKIVAGAAAMTQAQGQNIHDYPNKKNIFKMGQGVIGDSNSNPIPIIREWVKIPKGKQRFGLGDSLVMNISCIGEADNGLESCGFALYKEYQ